MGGSFLKPQNMWAGGGGASGIGPPTGLISVISLSSVHPEKALGLCLQEALWLPGWKSLPKPALSPWLVAGL